MKSKKLRLYLDTSVYGGVFEEEFSKDSRRILAANRNKKCIVLVSEIVSAELRRAPQRVSNLSKTLLSGNIETIVLTPEVLELRHAYLSRKILTSRSVNDATHVALATIYRADAIVSWNFRDIVNLDKMKLYNQVNIEFGYGFLEIISPREVSFDE